MSEETPKSAEAANIIGSTPATEPLPQQEQLPLAEAPNESLLATSSPEEFIEPPAATVNFEGQEAVNAAPVLESTSTEEPMAIKASTIISVVIILVAILGIAYLATRSMPESAVAGGGQTVKVSDLSEQGKVNILDEVKEDIRVQSNSSEQPALPKDKVLVYFGNLQKNPNSQDCGLVYLLEREADKKYDSNMVNTVISLLTPPNVAEREKGYVTAIPSGTILKYLKLDDSGTVEANFSGSLSTAAGSCAVIAIRSQIKATLLQFASVKSVVICVDGNCNEEEILQP
jgi:hypothetical protein